MAGVVAGSTLSECPCRIHISML